MDTILIISLVILIIACVFILIGYIGDNTPDEKHMINCCKRITYICLIIQLGWIYIIMSEYQVKEKTIIMTNNWENIEFSEIVKVIQIVEYIPHTTLQRTTTQIEILKGE